MVTKNETAELPSVGTTVTAKDVTAVNLFKTFSTDGEKELKGVWVPIGGDGELLVASTESPRWKDFTRKHIHPILPKRDWEVGQDWDNPKLKGLMIDGIATFLLLDWKNAIMPNADGEIEYEEQIPGEELVEKITPYSVDAAKRALGYRAFFELVLVEAGNMQHFKSYVADEAAKKLES